MDKCKKCSKNLPCNRKQCNFKSWIYTKNYGVPRRVENETRRQNNNRIY